MGISDEETDRTKEMRRLILIICILSQLTTNLSN